MGLLIPIFASLMVLITHPEIEEIVFAASLPATESSKQKWQEGEQACGQADQPFTKNFSLTRAQPSQLPMFSGLVRRQRLLGLPEYGEGPVVFGTD